MKKSMLLQTAAVVLLSFSSAAWADAPRLGPVQRYTRASLEHFLQNSLIRGDEQARFQVVVTHFTHASNRDSIYPTLERLLHSTLDREVLDFYEMRFSIADATHHEELYQVTCRIDDWQTEHYLNILNCVTRGPNARALTPQDRAGLPFYLTQHLGFWFAYYEEIQFQNP